MAYVKKFYDDDEQQKASQGEAEGAPLPGSSMPAQGGATGNKDYTKSNFVSGKALLDKNRNAPTAQNGFLNDYSKQITDAGSAATKSYGDFETGVGNTVGKTKVDNATIDKATKGDDKAFSNVMSVLKPANNGKIENWKGYDPNIGVSGATSLLSGAGAQNAFTQQQQKQGNYGYSQGQAALDSTLFGRSDYARDLVRKALDQRAGVYKEAEDLKLKANDVVSAGEKTISDNVKGLQGQLGSRADQITAKANARAQKASKLSDKQKADIKKSLSPQMAQQFEKWFKNAQKDPALAKMLSEQASSADWRVGSGHAVQGQGTKADYLRAFVDARINGPKSQFYEQMGGEREVQGDGLRDIAGNESVAGNRFTVGQTIEDELLYDDFYNYGDFSAPMYDKSQAAGYNRIMDLLGKNSRVQASKNPSASINEKEIDAYLRKALRGLQG